MNETAFPFKEGGSEGRAPEPGFTARKVVNSDQLLGGAREIAIRHEGQEYRLQITRNGKLILTK